MTERRIRVESSTDSDLERLKADLAKKGWDEGRLKRLGIHWDKGNGIPGGAAPSETAGTEGSEQPGEEAWAGVRYRIDPPNPRPAAHINCEERLHLCKAVCCKLNFILSPSEVQSGKVKWDEEHPYLIAHQSNGYCAHIDCKLRCNIYSDRPSLCRRFDCSNDPRIWKDFDKMIPNREWIEANTSSEEHQIPRLQLPSME